MWRERDPIFSFEQRLVDADLVGRDEIEAVWAELRDDIDEAIAFAEESPLPTQDQIMADVYTEAARP